MSCRNDSPAPGRTRAVITADLHGDGGVDPDLARRGSDGHALRAARRGGHYRATCPVAAFVLVPAWACLYGIAFSAPSEGERKKQPMAEQRKT
jgi:hypothetical protein